MAAHPLQVVCLLVWAFAHVTRLGLLSHDRLWQGGPPWQWPSGGITWRPPSVEPATVATFSLSLLSGCPCLRTLVFIPLSDGMLMPLNLLGAAVPRARRSRRSAAYSAQRWSGLPL